MVNYPKLWCLSRIFQETNHKKKKTWSPIFTGGLDESHMLWRFPSTFWFPRHPRFFRTSRPPKVLELVLPGIYLPTIYLFTYMTTGDFFGVHVGKYIPDGSHLGKWTISMGKFSIAKLWKITRGTLLWTNNWRYLAMKMVHWYYFSLLTHAWHQTFSQWHRDATLSADAVCFVSIVIYVNYGNAFV